jgi:hypothetical protein
MQPAIAIVGRLVEPITTTIAETATAATTTSRGYPTMAAPAATLEKLVAAAMLSVAARGIGGITRSCHSGDANPVMPLSPRPESDRNSSQSEL